MEYTNIVSEVSPTYVKQKLNLVQALKEVGYGGLVNEASGSVVRGGATMMGGASRGGGTVGGMMGGG